MLERYDEIILFLNNVIFEKQYLNPISAIICMMTAQKVGNTDVFNELMKLEFVSDTFIIVKEFYETKDKKVLDKLKLRPYPNMIKQKLLEQ